MSSPQFIDPKSEDDPILSPIFLSSAEDITSASSSSNSSSHDSGSPRNDWILPPNANVNIAGSPALWSGPGQLNHFDLRYPSEHWGTMDLDSELASFLPDTSHQFSIDPNALHFGGHVYGRGCETNGNGQGTLAGCDSGYQFSLSPPSEDHFTSTSVSPEVGLDVPPPSSLAVFQSPDNQIQTPLTPVSSLISEPAMSDTMTSTSPKVAIPRLRITHAEPMAPVSSIQANILASQNAPIDPDIQSFQSQPMHMTKANRPKTSHTTIERRYRTNLNSRILALRRAVPALRILERSAGEGGITQGKGLTGASAPKAEFHDVINERGYVDGVKAAKKNSKGVVLGKAVEYIRALKRREMRLRREMDGLKALLLGLVGGQELLTEWEKDWRAKFGGEEMDEVDEDLGDDMDGDGEDGGEGEDDEEDEVEEEDDERSRKNRPRKRGKLDTSVSSVKSGDKKPSPGIAPAPQAGEKRKRGRPRKIQTPSTNVEVPKLVLHPANVASIGTQSHGEPPKYLLAAFALFNFFSNSPLSFMRSSTASSQTHDGTVLTHPPIGPASTNTPDPSWLSFQFVNSVLSVLLLIFILSDGTLRAKLCAPLKLFGYRVRDRSESETEGSRPPPRMGVIGLLKVAITRCVTNVNASNNEDLKAWRPIAEGMVLNSSPSLISAVQTYLSFSSAIASHPRSISDHITLALLSHTFSLSTAQKRWSTLQAAINRQGTNTSALERLSLSLDLTDAIRILEETKEAGYPNDTPVKKLARYIVIKSTKSLAAKEWLDCVSSNEAHVHELGDRDGSRESDPSSSPSPVTAFGSLPQALVLEAGKQLGGKMGELVAMLERCHTQDSTSLWREADKETEIIEESDEQESRSSTSSFEEISTELYGQESQSEEIEHTRSMLLATVLYKQIFFPSTPKAYPSTNTSNILALRRTLASAAFDCSPETEDARDKVVDILAEMSRASKHR